MDLVSFKSFLKSGKPTTADYVRFLRMVLQGLSTQVVEGDSEDLAAYRNETSEFAERVTEESRAEDILLSVTVGLRSLEEYNRRTKKFLGAEGMELKTALRSLTEAVALLAHTRGEPVQLLAALERKIEHASAIEDLRVLRIQLQETLSVIGEESTRLRTEAEARMEALQQRLEAVFSPDGQVNAVLYTLDAVTGLENRAAAEKLISERVEQGRPCVAALFVVSKLAMVNRRFGRAVGDEVLLMVAHHIGQSLPANSVLFRWSGPALAAVIDIQSNSEDLHRKLTRIASTPLEKNIEAGERQTFVPVTVLLFTQRTGAASVPKGVFKAMDQFVSSNAMEEQPAVT